MGHQGSRGSRVYQDPWGHEASLGQLVPQVGQASKEPQDFQAFQAVQECVIAYKTTKQVLG